MLHDMPEFASYIENSFGCNVFLWFNVIYISLSRSLCASLLLSLDVLFSYIKIHSGSTKLSLCQCALSPHALCLLHSTPHSLSLFLFTCFALFVALSFLSLCIHRQRQRQRPLFALALFLLRLSFCNCALCPHSLRTEKSENT